MLLLQSNTTSSQPKLLSEEPEEYSYTNSGTKSPPSIELTQTFSQALSTDKNHLNVQTGNRPGSGIVKPIKFNEKFTITILNVNHNRPLNPSYVVVTFGDKIYQTPLSKEKNGNWNCTFEFEVSYHYQLFGTCQLDLYEYTWLIPDSHKGRAEIRLATLDGFPESFKNYYELYDRKYSLGTISELARRTKLTQNLGAIQVKINYRFMKPSSRKDYLKFSSQHNNNNQFSSIERESIKEEDNNIDNNTNNEENNEIEIDTKDIESERQLHEVLINPLIKENFNKIEEDDNNNNKDPYSYGKVSLISGDSDSIHDQLLNNDDDEGMFNFVGSYILSKGTRAVLKGITRVYLAFNQGLELKYIEFFNGILLLEKYYLKETELLSQKEECVSDSSLLITNFSKVKEANYFYKYALAAYGWRGLVFFSKITPLTAGQIMTDHGAIKEYLKLNDNLLLGYEFRSNELFQPTYFIALDQITQSLVISIRGTMSVLDTLTDLVCEYQPWRGGLVHSGILAVAQSLMKNVIPSVMAHAIQHQVRKIYLVGHSLGGATASLLTMMLIDHLHEFRLPKPEFELRCFAFGPPPSFSLNLAKSERYLPYIHTFVVQNDIIPRLSYGAMMDFKAAVLAATEVINEHNPSVLSMERFTSMFQTSEEAKKQLELKFEILDKALKHQLKVEQLNPKLYLAGKIYHLKSKDKLVTPFDKLNNGSKEKQKKKIFYYCFSEEADNFLGIKVNSSMLLDHLPSAYDFALEQAQDLIDQLADFADTKL
ncbi:hypothetical protein K502DRAFT_294458 [Neoconidiobolus thromboides FSU 785]|nr:hypothetical protein K502DRAFT_294458 [Neoconidiobolus thromboides FSU 785]